MTSVGDRVDQDPRLRHPSTRSAAGQSLGLAVRLAGKPASANYPLVGLACSAARGVDGRSRQEFGLGLGVDVEVLERAESGGIAIDDLPAPLRLLTSVTEFHRRLLDAFGDQG